MTRIKALEAEVARISAEFAQQAERVAALEAALRDLWRPTTSAEDWCSVSTEDGECIWCDSGEDGRYPLPDDAHESDCPWLVAKALLSPRAAEGEGER